MFSYKKFQKANFDKNNISMKRIYLLLAALALFVISADAQRNKRSILYDLIIQKHQKATVFTKLQLFKETENISALKNQINGVVSRASNLAVDKDVARSAFEKRPEAITLPIPYLNQHTYTLELAKELINTGAFSFGTIENNHTRTKVSTDQGLHYRGYVNGDSTSLACISMFANGDVMGLFANTEGNFIIGKVGNTDTNYIVYNTKDLLVSRGFRCAASETYPPGIKEISGNKTFPLTQDIPPVLCQKLKLYWEGDYQLYSYNFASNLTNTKNYLTGLFNMVATMYQNEGITVELSESYVWTTADSYRNTSSSAGLTDFQSRWNAMGDSYNGDLAHLVAGGTTNNGGVAYLLPAICGDRDYTYGYSNVWGEYNTVPVFSWDVEVLTHETGHNLGSNHTHWCGWNTGPGSTCGAIDNCYTLETGGGCNTCPVITDTAALPQDWQGTVMSYCHLTNSIGINLANGFGPLPQAVIRNTVSTSSCIHLGVSWTGAVDSTWENPGNWSCGSIPGADTEVILNSGLVNYPVINSDAVCRSLTQQPGANVKVNTGYSLTITGSP